MTNRYFDEWLSKFRPSISTYDYYVDFEKVYRNVDEVKIELNLLNSLIGSKDIKTDFVNLLKRYPEILKAIPILLAKRENEIYCQDENGGFLYKFDYGKYPPNNHRYYEMYTYFMEKSGLFDLLQNHIIKDLVDYVTGVETGLDSNGRKNRGGHLMENLVEKYIQEAGFVRDVNYFKEMYLVDIEKKWKIDLSALSNDGKAAKRFDFVVKTSKMIYAVETNFYTGGGSKLNETARSYKMLSQEANTIDGFTFVWFTDGIGWKSARGNLRETFDVMDTIYSIDDMEKPFKISIDVDNDFDEDIINTKHNLSSKVLKNICDIVGIVYNNAMQARATYIDSVLLKHRNSIGHAGKLAKGNTDTEESLSYEQVVKLKEFILLMLDYYAQILLDYTEKEYYLIEKEDERLEYEKEKENELSGRIERMENSLNATKHS